MNPIREKHREAMKYASKAFVARAEGRITEFEAFSIQAYELELEAVQMVAEDLSTEPTRSVLHRSAATLAFNCKKFEEAEKLIKEGLRGNPPIEIAEELKKLYEQINIVNERSGYDAIVNGKKSHTEDILIEVSEGTLLHSSFTKINRDEVELIFSGQLVRDGSILIDVFVTKIQDFQRLIARTAERLLGIEYRTKGDVSRKVNQLYPVYLKGLKQGSFVVSLKVGTPYQQLTLPGIEEEKVASPADVIEEIITCLNLFNQEAQDDLREKISQEAYYRNFIGLASRIAPDGKDLNSVQVNFEKGNKINTLTIKKPAKPITNANETNVDNQPIVVEGELRFADSRIYRNQEGKIEIIREDGTSEKFIVPLGMMSDIVRPLYEYRVKAVGVKDRKGKFLLQQIDKVS
jgi:hypothetical protein